MVVDDPKGSSRPAGRLHASLFGHVAFAAVSNGALDTTDGARPERVVGVRHQETEQASETSLLAPY